MDASGAGWNGEKFVEGQGAGFAAFPACGASRQSVRVEINVELERFTFLSFMENRWSWVVVTFGFGSGGEQLATALVKTFLRRVRGHRGCQSNLGSIRLEKSRELRD